MFQKSFIVLVFLFHLAVAQFDIEKLASYSNDFCFSLTKTFPPKQNVFISPLSIYVTMGMVYAGANGYTAEKMKKILSFDEDTHRSFGTLLRFLNVSSDEYALEIANALLYKENYYLLPEFKYILHGYYGALMKEIDVDDSSHAIEEVNKWIGEKTHEKIPKLLEELPENLRIILLNAVYFKGVWQKPFDPTYTINDIFYNDGVYEVPVTLMGIKDKFLYTKLPNKGLEAVALPYKGKHINMIIVLPLSRGKLEEVERNFDAETLTDIIKNFTMLPEVRVTMPKFKLEDSRELKASLTYLGLGNLFNENSDFSGITGRRDLFVSDVLHKAMIEVNEKGTEAAVSTGLTITKFSAYPIFFVDHPFLFFIVDLRSNLILFAGRVTRL